MINTPAIVAGEFGKGRVVSISPHPESTPGLEIMIEKTVRFVDGKTAIRQPSTLKVPR